jgi:pimeloyl-ACP methyl ester carboxylesterase
MPFVLFEGCHLSYTVRGSGPPLLLIQGVGVQGDAWLPQTGDLARDFTCITFDNRGMAKSQPVAAAITVEQMTRDALAILDATGFSSAHVAGHSLGGVIALQLAITAPSRVRSLALLCTFSGGRTAAPPTARMLWLGARTRIGTRLMRRRSFLRLVMPPGPIADQDRLAERIAILFGHDLADQPPIVSRQLRALRRSDTSPRLHELPRVPVLIVTGHHDPIGPPAAGRALAAAIPGSRYIEVPDASHGLPISHAALTNATLREHLGNVPGQSGARSV